MRSSHASITANRLGSSSVRSIRPRCSAVKRVVYTDPAMPRPARRVDPETVLEQAELDALEPRRRNQQIAEVQEIEPGHRLQDVDLVEQQPLDLATVEVADGAQHVAISDDPGEDSHDGVRLVEDLLEPQLVRLVHDDEQQLVVGVPAVPITLRLLARQGCSSHR